MTTEWIADTELRETAESIIEGADDLFPAPRKAWIACALTDLKGWIERNGIPTPFIRHTVRDLRQEIAR